MRSWQAGWKPQKAPAKKSKDQGKEQETGVNLVDISYFGQLELKVAEVLQAEPVKKADKLLKLQIDLGGETRQIVAGIAQHYRPEELVGKKIVVVANLKPAKIRGEVSQGMLLAASTEDQLSLVTVEKDLPAGAKVK